MPSLKSNLVKRVDRLPKPTNASKALQPLFEAISNAIHSTQDRFEDATPVNGRVVVHVSTNRNKTNVSASVEDNGYGLDEKNWDAFTTTDTDNKITIGGKGVGRLLWLDCFREVRVESVYEVAGGLEHRSFDFVLSNSDQIQNELVGSAPAGSSPYFKVQFKGLRENAYKDRFPGRGSYIFQHLASHFLPVFIGSRSPEVRVVVGDDERVYPRDISSIVIDQPDPIQLHDDEFGPLSLAMMTCTKDASSDLKGANFVHFVAHDRTVLSQSIDGKLGLKFFGEQNDQSFHAVIKGEFLDRHVNQERTAFNFEDAVIDRIINTVCMPVIEPYLAGPLDAKNYTQRKILGEITQTYPSVAFGEIDELHRKIPAGELDDDAIYGHLSRERFRRDQRQAEKIRHALARLKDGGGQIGDFHGALAEAIKAIEEAEQKSLAEYVVRRKVVLDFVTLLLGKVRDAVGDSAYQQENLLHSFICPLRVQTVTGGNTIKPNSSHDLWIVDERLTFAEYFSSDSPFDELSSAFQSSDRPDLLVFDYVHGLRTNGDQSKVLLVEFKRPGRRSYNDDENPQHQVEGYVRKLKSGALTDVRGRPIRLDENTVFYCYIVADIIGKLDDWTFSWDRTPDGRGRVYQPRGGFKGQIELVGWDELLGDAKARNAAFFDRMGLSGKSYFDDEN